MAKKVINCEMINASELHLGSSNVRIQNTKTCVKPDPKTESNECAGTLMLGVRYATIENNGTTLKVEGTYGKKVTGTKVLASHGITVKTKDAKEQIDARPGAVVSAYDVQETEGFECEVKNSVIEIKKREGAIAAYAAGPKTNIELKDCDFSIANGT